MSETPIRFPASHTFRVIGLLVTFLISICLAGLGQWVFSKSLAELDPRARFGLGGILGLGMLGSVTFPIGLIPGGFRWGIGVVGVLAVLGLLGWFRTGRTRFIGRKPEGLELLGIVAVLALIAIPLLGVLSPSTAQDWDSIAYHLAVPKLWLQAGQIEFISFIHHSNFPFVVDNLFVWGLVWGGQAGAKAFSWMFLVFGALALFGLARGRFGVTAGLVAALLFVATPVIVWESGTAYIDVAHGLFAGLGAWFLLGPDRKGRWVLGAFLLGLAVGSKYTGLQTLAAVAVFLPFAGTQNPLSTRGEGAGGGESLRATALAIAVSLAVGGGWYVRNAINTGNPVYPFFYEQLGGKNWNQKMADIYREEQKTFGVPGAAAIPSAIAGLAYQPGRYINPMPKLEVTPQGPVGAQGDPKGALGFAVVMGLFLVGAFARRFHVGAVFGFLVLSLLMWAVLSQQSRYIISLTPPLAIIVGGIAASRELAGKAMAAAVALQAAITLWVAQGTLLTPTRMQAAMGAVSEDAYLTRNVPIYGVGKLLDTDPEVKKVALFDEVFGFYLNKPYYWATYGHSTEIGYEEIDSAEKMVDSFRRMGFTHLYVNLRMQAPEFVGPFVASLGLTATNQGWQPIPAVPLDPVIADPMKQNVQLKWKPFLAEAVERGLITVDTSKLIRRDVLILKVNPK
jgi:hypothetical protein